MILHLEAFEAIPDPMFLEEKVQEHLQLFPRLLRRTRVGMEKYYPTQKTIPHHKSININRTFNCRKFKIFQQSTEHYYSKYF